MYSLKELNRLRIKVRLSLRYKENKNGNSHYFIIYSAARVFKNETASFEQQESLFFDMVYTLALLCCVSPIFLIIFIATINNKKWHHYHRIDMHIFYNKFMNNRQPKAVHSTGVNSNSKVWSWQSAADSRRILVILTVNFSNKQNLFVMVKHFYWAQHRTAQKRSSS